MSDLSQRAQADDKIDPALVSNIQDEVNQLQDLFGHDATRHDEYVSELDVTANVLAAAAENPSADKANDKLVLVRQDLDLKVKSARHALHAFGEKAELIEVVITTVRGPNPVSGYIVECTSELLGPSGTPQYPFNDPSNPSTRRRLPPGGYFVFAEWNGRRVATQHFDLSLGDAPNGPIRVLVP